MPASLSSPRSDARHPHTTRPSSASSSQPSYSFSLSLPPLAASSPTQSPTHLHDEEHVHVLDEDDGDLNPSPTPHLPSIDPLEHAEAAALDTLFSLLLNLSFVALIAAVVMFAAVFRLPARSTGVNAFNDRVQAWDDQFREQFDHVTFKLGGLAGSGGLLQMAMMEAGVDALNDEGSDLDSYDPLLYCYNASMQRPMRVSSSDVPQIAVVTLVATPMDPLLQSKFNVTLALSKRVVTRSLMPQQCTANWGQWQFTDHSCAYTVALHSACVRVIVDEHSASWQLHDPAAEGGVWRLQHATNDTAEVLEAEDAFGCSWDASKNDGTGGWAVGSYQPLDADSHLLLLSIGDGGAVKSGAQQRRLLSQTSAAAASATAASSSSSWMSSISSSASAAPPPLSVLLMVRHYADPYVYAVDLTHGTLWFGLARQSVLLLSLVLLILAVLAMLGKAGTRYDFWCGLMLLKQWIEGKRLDWQNNGGMGGFKAALKTAGVRSKVRGRRKGYEGVQSEDASMGYQEDNDLELEDATSEVKEEIEAGSELRISDIRDEDEDSRFELGDLDEAEDEEEERKQQREQEGDARAGDGEHDAARDEREEKQAAAAGATAATRVITSVQPPAGDPPPEPAEAVEISSPHDE